MYRTQPRYQATCFPKLGCTFDAVTGDGEVTTLAGIGTARDWNVNRCREYAHESGYTREACLTVDGLTVFDWYRPQ